MKRNTALLLAGVGTAGVLTAIAYRNGVKNIDFEIDDIQPTGDFSQLFLRIKCTNRNLLFGYPVPQIQAVVFADQDIEVGTVINTMLQYIPANQVSYITAVIHPNFAQSFNLIMSSLGQGQLPNNLTFTGEIKVGPIVIPFDTHTGIFSAIGGGRKDITLSKLANVAKTLGYKQIAKDILKVDLKDASKAILQIAQFEANSRPNDDLRKRFLATAKIFHTLHA